MLEFWYEIWHVYVACSVEQELTSLKIISVLELGEKF